MSNVFDHLHIKQHTAGSSNELSFDVLDAARTGIDDKQGKRRRRDAPSRKQSRSDASGLGSFHSTTGVPTLSRQSEVTRRKKERKIRSARLLIVAIVAAVAVMGMTTYAAYGQYQRMQYFQLKFDGVVQRFVAADQDLPSVEEFMAYPDGFSREQRDELRQNISKAELVINNILDDQDRVRSFAVTDIDKEALDQVTVAAQSRLSMMEAARATVDLAESSASTASEVNSIWTDVIGADQKAREASAAANRASSDDEVESAKKKTQEALDTMSQALEKLQELNNATAELDLTMHVLYLQKRIESLEHAVATGDALIASDRATASAENDAYNLADREAVELAKQLPDSVDETLEQSFTKDAQTLFDAYEKAREQAIEADSNIRQYL